MSCVYPKILDDTYFYLMYRIIIMITTQLSIPMIIIIIANFKCMICYSSLQLPICAN